MPPKKKGGKKKGKKAAADEAPADDAENAKEPTGPTDREVYLKKELNHLTNDLERLKKQSEELRKENEVLQQEAQHTRIESHEYMSYMAKKTHKRQTTIVSLSDQNQKELEKINSQKEQMLSDYEEKKNKLKATLLEKESLLTKARKEFQDLGEYRELREDQLKKIKQLEREVLHMRGKHSDTIQQLKAKFLQEKAEYTEESENKIQALALEANKKAVQCLNEHTTNIKYENRQLRAELLNLIRKSQVLNQHKQELEEQKKQLQREQQYSEDIRKLRGVRQKKALAQMEREEQENQ
uniref:coiled-coil domain-containing protein 166-like n=1 Tax=Styela clava TaxID=7725 RepID=UPI0019395CB6|nr:coiled-coil domain-containing protein 166-like [Styela clava]